MPPYTILCYGDSNTHGTRPMQEGSAMQRFEVADRWPGVLRAALGADCLVIEEGLPGRTTVHDDPIEGVHRNGLRTLRACLESHVPLDLVVLMLGTNDLKTRFSVTPADIAGSIERLLREILLCTDSFGPGALGAILEGGAAKSRALAPLYQAVALRHGASFLDAGSIIRVSPIDGVHFEADQHHRLGAAVAAVIGGMAIGAAVPAV